MLFIRKILLVKSATNDYCGYYKIFSRLHTLCVVIMDIGVYRFVLIVPNSQLFYTLLKQTNRKYYSEGIKTKKTRVTIRRRTERKRLKGTLKTLLFHNTVKIIFRGYTRTMYELAGYSCKIDRASDTIHRTPHGGIAPLYTP